MTDRASARAAIEAAAIEQFEARPRDTGIRRTGRPAAETHVAEQTREWLVVIPVKGTGDAKSRLGDHPDREALALAIALDTAEAALGAPSVVGVLVVTSPAVAAPFDELGVLVVTEQSAAGLASAVASGIAVATEMGAPGRGIAVLLGDLPALAPHELGAALAEAAGHELALVPDADGTGTVLITAADGSVHRPAFGTGSRAAHAAAGYTELDVSADSGLRRDVDTGEQLDALSARVGRRTAALLAGSDSGGSDSRGTDSRGTD